MSRRAGGPGRPATLGALRSAWRRVRRLWRPMAGWSLLVWAVVAAFLGPLSSFLVGWSWLRGDAEVVANQALLTWLLTPQGFLWLVLSASLSLSAAALHFAGAFHIVTDDLRGRRPGLLTTALRLAPEVPAIARLCGAAAVAGLAIILPLAGGLVGIHRLFLGAQDINYYLSARPPAWWWAVGVAGAWTLAWLVIVVRLFGRILLALPAYLDGHRPLTSAVRRAWRAARRESGRVTRTVVLTVAVWLVAVAILDAAALVAGRIFLGWVASAADSLHVLLAASGGWALLSLALDATMTLTGIAYVSAVVTKLYHEDTALAGSIEAPPSPPLSVEIRELVVRWSRPHRLLPAVAVLLALSSVSGALLLERIPEPRPVAVTAHRAGPPPAPENTLPALEAAIEAGADWSEIDVQLTADRVPVLLHDADLRRVAGDPRRISRVPYRELRGLVQGPDDGSPSEERRILTLEEFLERAGGRIGAALELKYYGWDPELAPAVVEVLREGGWEDRVMVVSLDLRAVRQLRELAPDLSVGYAAAVAVGDLSRLPVNFLFLSRRAATPAAISLARSRGIDVHVWTLNRAAAMSEAIQVGAAGIVTDRPALAVEVRDELADLPAVGRLLLRFGHLLSPDEPGERPAEEGRAGL